MKIETIKGFRGGYEFILLKTVNNVGNKVGFLLPQLVTLSS